MRLAGREHVVLRLVGLEHAPGAFHVVAREAPVALRVQVAEPELVLFAAQDRTDGARDLARDERRAAARRLVVEEDAVHRVHPVRLAVVARDPVAEDLAHAVWTARMEGRLLVLRRLAHLAEHLARRRLVEAALDVLLADRVEEAQRAHRIGVRRVLRHAEAHLHVTLGAEVVHLVGPDRAHPAVRRR